MPAKVYAWNKLPILRFLIPLIAGIVLQWEYAFPLFSLLAAFIVLLIMLGIYQFNSLRYKFQFAAVHGILATLALLFSGALLIFYQDVRNNPRWIGKHYTSERVLITLTEPLVEKERSYKALAEIKAIYKEGKWQAAKGKTLLYFKKDSSVQELGYGAQLVLNKPLQVIKNAGNPGGFDYKKYSLFHGITHQCFLNGNDFVFIKEDKASFQDFIYRSRAAIVSILQTHIEGGKEQGLAEALLIGYKDDLDKNLVEAYSNTGVVHIIAISGLHIGLIYWLLLRITKPLNRRKLYWTRLFIILSSLWLFSLLAGAQPSVLRSAVMFTCIAFGTVLNKRNSVYNSLFLSAFILLCLNPFWLWDVGFQLSYAAVLSIIIFFRPIYNWSPFSNKVINFLWKLIAVSLAAQILTLPFTVFYFHQFPVLFLLTNLIAVPLSSIILIAEIILCGFAFINPVADVLGLVTEWLIWLMNTCIEELSNVSFAVWDGLWISVLQAFILTVHIIAIGYWLLEKNKKAFWSGAAAFVAFLVLRTHSFIEAEGQQKLIVYNVPRHQAIDIIDGRTNLFIGDQQLMRNEFLRNFHIRPSHILHRVKGDRATTLHAFEYKGKKVLIIDTTIAFKPLSSKIEIDLLILSKNPRLYMDQLLNSFTVKRIIMDASVPAWKAKLWKKDLDSFRIAYFDVAEKGAFVMKL